MHTAAIEFHANVIIRQEITIIEKDLSVEDIVIGLEDGSLETTIGHEGVETIGTTITERETGRIVARINAQSVTEDQNEFQGFQESLDWDLNETEE